MVVFYWSLIFVFCYWRFYVHIWISKNDFANSLHMLREVIWWLKEDRGDKLQTNVDHPIRKLGTFFTIQWSSILCLLEKKIRDKSTLYFVYKWPKINKDKEDSNYTISNGSNKHKIIYSTIAKYIFFWKVLCTIDHMLGHKNSS